MSTLQNSVRLGALVAAAVLAFQAQAAARFPSNQVPGASASTPASLGSTYIDVNIAGFNSFGGFGDPLNSSVFLDIGAGSTVTGWDYNSLSFSTSGGSWLSEFVISVNNSNASGYLDAAPSGTDASGTFGPASGSWNTAAGGKAGAPFVAANGTLWVTVYELFTDAGLNATVNAGTLRIYYDAAVVPEPATYGLMGLGLLAVAGAARRRRTH